MKRDLDRAQIKIDNRHVFESYLSELIPMPLTKRELLAFVSVELRDLKSLMAVPEHQSGEEAVTELEGILKGVIKGRDRIFQLENGLYVLAIRKSENLDRVDSMCHSIFGSANQVISPHSLALTLAVVYYPLCAIQLEALKGAIKQSIEEARQVESTVHYYAPPTRNGCKAFHR